MIADSAVKTKVNNFSKLTFVCGGRKLELFLQINILIYLVGSCISYQIISNPLGIIYFSHWVVLKHIRSFRDR